ncbi:MAG: hypothetical protein NC120_06240 [Ruminococcus sp.]|nr:hypothetical protein [Ruminococcus sp.]
MVTKEQERKALIKIRSIISELGDNSYVGTAFEGCFEIAEENIDYDFCGSMKQNLETAVKEIDTLKELLTETENLKAEVSRLKERLEKEQEWKPYEDKDNVSQADYEHLISGCGTKYLSDDEAKEILYDWFGFAKEKVKIINSVNTYEISRHGRLRKTGTLERRPAYNATDWNYIRFNCGGVGYELYNDQIRLFLD